MTPGRVVALGPALRCVLAPNPSPMTLDGTRSYVVGRERPVVVDPGPAEPDHVAALVAALGGHAPAAILLTHAHPDHAPAALRLHERTGAPIWLARGALAPALPAEVVSHWPEPGDAVATDAGELRALPTPGHAPEHLAFAWDGDAAPGGRALFVGDLLMGEGDTALVAPPEGDLAEYLASLDRVEDVGAAVFFPTHGPPLAQPADALARYRAHRRARMEQVLAALGARRQTAASLVQRVYGPRLPEELAAAAEGSLHAVLLYLERQGRVRRAVGGGHLRWERV